MVPDANPHSASGAEEELPSQGTVRRILATAKETGVVVPDANPRSASVAEEELPSQGTVRRMLATAKEAQSGAATLERRTSAPPQQALSKLGGGKNKCMRCSKSVYAAESIAGPGGEWHKQCLACNACRKLLDTTTLMEHRGEVYCRACFSKSAFS